MYKVLMVLICWSVTLLICLALGISAANVGIVLGVEFAVSLVQGMVQELGP